MNFPGLILLCILTPQSPDGDWYDWGLTKENPASVIINLNLTKYLSG